MADPKARACDCMEKFGLTQHELKLTKGLPDIGR
jgi:hypothetical protein